MNTSYDDLASFAAVVRAGSFTSAAAQLGVTQSAISQTVRSLERRLDLKLINRTTRSLAPTAAGERLYEVIGPRFADVDQALERLREMGGKPAGTIRITATEHAVQSLIAPRLLKWLPKYPDINVEVSSDNKFTDIVAERFDIGVRLGGDVARDMIAVRIAPDMRMAVVGSPAYLRKHSPPRTPAELATHDCTRLRLPTHGGLLNWEFRRGKRAMVLHVSGRLVFNRNALMVEAALAGQGLAWVPADLVDRHVASGKLVEVLRDHAMSYPGYHAYYATRRASPALALVIDALRG